MTFFTEPGCSLFMSLKRKALSDSILIRITNQDGNVKLVLLTSVKESIKNICRISRFDTMNWERGHDRGHPGR